MTVLAETFRVYTPDGLEPGVERPSVALAYQAMERLFPGVDVGQTAGEVRESLSALFSGTLRSVSPEEVVINVTSGLGALAGGCLGIKLYPLFHRRRRSCGEQFIWGLTGANFGYLGGLWFGLSLIKGAELSN